MRKDLAVKAIDFSSSFLSCEKDAERILKILFVESRPYSDQLKRLLVINAEDCLTNTTNEVYTNKIKEMSVSRMIQDGYIRLDPRVKLAEHEEVKSYLIMSFDNFTPTSNPQFRDCTITFDILCNNDEYKLNDFTARPLKIAGYIDGLLNNKKLTGIGTLQFAACSQIVLDEKLSGYTLMFKAVHGSDDKIPDNG